MRQVAYGAGGTGQVEDGLDLPLLGQWLDGVVLDEAEAGPGQQGINVSSPARQQVVDTDNLVAGVQDGFAQVGANEPGAARNEDVQVAVSSRLGLPKSITTSRPTVSQKTSDRSIKK